MTISCYLKSGLIGSWNDYSDKIDCSSKPQITERIDDAFASGSVKLWLSRSTPIPPYSPFLVDGRYMVGKSKVTKYLTESNLYVHDVELLEATAFLKCIIIGIKVYSAESPTFGVDYSDFISLVALANQMYPDYTFYIGNGGNVVAYLVSKITTQKTYRFNDTDTLYDCLNKICLENNQKLRVTFDTADPTIFNILLEEVPKTTTYTITGRVIGDVQDQNAEDYGRFLETHASNVVDRNTVTRVEWLTPSNENEIALTVDNAKLTMPTVIEDIVEFGVHQNGTIQFHIKGLENYYNDPDSTFNGSYQYSLLADMWVMVGSEKVYIFEELYNNYLANYFPYVTKQYFYENVYSNPYNVNGLQIDIPYSCNGKFPIDIEEKSKWDIRTSQDQSEELFYTTGTKIIENLNATYKNDLWNTVIGNARYNFLHYHNESVHTTYRELELFMYTYLTNNDNPMGYLYWCDYHAVTNPKIRDDKQSDELIITNEFAPISRSYGNSANSIDFDKIIPNMHISNLTLGRIERTIQLDITEDTVLPSAGQKIVYAGSTWYISNIVFDYGVIMVVATLTLVVNYNKKADSIGVDSQKEFTNNPLRDIVERPIMIDTTTSSTISALIKQSWYMRFKFYDHTNTLITNTDPNDNDRVVSMLIKRCSVQATDDTILFYCEMDDQIVFDYEIPGTNSWYQIPFRYTTQAAECKSFDVELGQMTATRAGLPIMFPVGTNSSFVSRFTFANMRIDKDAREKLTFSIKMKHS